MKASDTSKDVAPKEKLDILLIDTKSITFTLNSVNKKRYVQIT